MKNLKIRIKNIFNEGKIYCLTDFNLKIFMLIFLVLIITNVSSCFKTNKMIKQTTKAEQVITDTIIQTDTIYKKNKVNEVTKVEKIIMNNCDDYKVEIKTLKTEIEKLKAIINKSLE